MYQNRGPISLVRLNGGLRMKFHSIKPILRCPRLAVIIWVIFFGCDSVSNGEPQGAADTRGWQEDPFLLKRHLLSPKIPGEASIRLLPEECESVSHLSADEIAGQQVEWVDGVIGRALRFSGAGITARAAPDLALGFSVESWVWLERPPRGHAGFFGLVAWPGVFSAGFETGGLNRLRPQMEVFTDRGGFDARTIVELPYRQWFHIRFSYDPKIAPRAEPENAPAELHSSFRIDGTPPLAISIEVNGSHVGNLTPDLIGERFLRMDYRNSKGFMPVGQLRPGKGPLVIGDGFHGLICELYLVQPPWDESPVPPWLSGRPGDFLPFRPAAIHPSITGPLEMAEAMEDETGAFRLIAAEAVPTLQSLGLYVRYAGSMECEMSLGVRYRRAADTEWSEGMDLVRDRIVREFRGSLFGLEENTDYEVELLVRGMEVEPHDGNCLTLRVRTWSSEVPVGEVREIPNGVLTEPLEITGQHGSTEGWIVYRPKNGGETVVDVRAGGHSRAVTIEDCSYVILEGLTVRGGERHGIYVGDSHDIRIRRNEISHWSLEGEERSDLRNGLYVHPNTKELINQHDAIHLGRLTSRIVVEDNFIHTPRGTGTCWRFGHPAGPQAMTLHGAREVVIRNNEMIGAEKHWFNDVIGTYAQNSAHGGIYRDVDINGNFLAFSQDNHVELDGGAMNARLWNNRMLWGYREVAMAPTIHGPSYVLFNLIDQRGDEFGRGGSPFKLGWPGRNFSRSYVLHNTVIGRQTPGAGEFGRGDGIFVLDAYANDPGYREILAANNLSLQPDRYFDPADSLLGEPEPSQVVFLDRMAGDYRLAHGSFGNAGSARVNGLPFATPAAPDLGAVQRLGPAVSTMVPRRSDGIRVWPQNIEMAVLAGTSGEAFREITLEMPSEAGEQWEAHASSPWIQIEPQSGDGGSPSTIRVGVDAKNLQPRTHRGVITFRSDTGLNRSVSLHAHVGHRQPWTRVFEIERMARLHESLTAISSEENVSGTGFARVTREVSKDHPLEFVFDVPRRDSYYVLGRFRASDSVSGQPQWSLDGSKPRPWFLPLSRGGGSTWHWLLLDPHGYTRTKTRERGFEVEGGRHIFRLERVPSGIEIDCIVVSNEPYPPKGLEK